MAEESPFDSLSDDDLLAEVERRKKAAPKSGPGRVVILEGSLAERFLSGTDQGSKGSKKSKTKEAGSEGKSRSRYFG